MIDQMSDGERMLWVQFYMEALKAGSVFADGDPIQYAVETAAHGIKELRKSAKGLMDGDAKAFLQDMLEGDTEDFPIAMTEQGDEVTERRRIR